MSDSSDSSSLDDDDDDDMDDMMMFFFIKKHEKNFIDRIPCRTSMLSGKEYIREILCGNPIQCYVAIRMKPHVLLNFCDKLKMMGLLQDRKEVSVEEGLSMTFALSVVKTVDRGEVQPVIRANSRWYPFFKNCIGAIDGTHVAAWASSSKQNGYPNLKGFLAPYRGERYHRSDWQRVSGVRGKKELFNFMHSSVRNVIERAFGVVKKRFHILQNIPNYPLRRQMLIPHACCALHNYIRMEDRGDTLFTRYGDENIQNFEESLQVVQEGFPLDMTSQDEMLQVRDSIADMLWEKYTQRRQRHLRA
ncbi:uncharacterized protein LOC111882910 [Lactuca sativa]|uniref:uncharacterized protein LOC111882910 n=1 Tax=Lactuca sativa TaxID=4236 RepID=UPI000CD7F536|nr:uncharacterized protein LOC111882910 [Lactuca sativa]